MNDSLPVHKVTWRIQWGRSLNKCLISCLSGKALTPLRYVLVDLNQHFPEQLPLNLGNQQCDCCGKLWCQESTWGRRSLGWGPNAPGNHTRWRGTFFFQDRCSLLPAWEGAGDGKTGWTSPRMSLASCPSPLLCLKRRLLLYKGWKYVLFSLAVLLLDVYVRIVFINPRAF